MRWPRCCPRSCSPASRWRSSSSGPIVLIRSAPGADAEEKEQEAEFEAATATDRTFWSATGASFLLLFAAEWGDLSQLLTISLVTKYHDHVNVFIGAWSALLVVSGLAVIAGRWLLGHLRLRTIHYAGALVCLVLGRALHRRADQSALALLGLLRPVRVHAGLRALVLRGLVVQLLALAACPGASSPWTVSCASGTRSGGRCTWVCGSSCSPGS